MQLSLFLLSAILRNSEKRSAPAHYNHDLPKFSENYYPNLPKVNKAIVPDNFNLLKFRKIFKVTIYDKSYDKSDK